MRGANRCTVGGPDGSLAPLSARATFHHHVTTTLSLACRPQIHYPVKSTILLQDQPPKDVVIIIEGECTVSCKVNIEHPEPVALKQTAQALEKGSLAFIRGSAFAKRELADPDRARQPPLPFPSLPHPRWVVTPAPDSHAAASRRVPRSLQGTEHRPVGSGPRGHLRGRGHPARGEEQVRSGLGVLGRVTPA